MLSLYNNQRIHTARYRKLTTDGNGVQWTNGKMEKALANVLTKNSSSGSLLTFDETQEGCLIVSIRQKLLLQLILTDDRTTTQTGKSLKQNIYSFQLEVLQ